MGFSLKKVAKSVAKVASTPVRAVATTSAKVFDKTGINDISKKSLGIDLSNMQRQLAETSKGNIRTGSDEFKRAGFDTIKVGAIAAGGAGAITLTQAGGATLLASKIQSGKGASVGDFASLAGLPTGINTDFGNFDFGNLDIFKSKPVTSSPSFFNDLVSPSGISGTNDGGGGFNPIMIGVIVLVVILVFVLILK